jgi:DNA-binding beta-propeller fold protein YncE
MTFVDIKSILWVYAGLFLFLFLDDSQAKKSSANIHNNATNPPDEIIFAASPNGDKLFVAHKATKIIHILSTKDYQLLDSIKIDSNPTSISVSPNGLSLSIRHANNKELTVIDVTTNMPL